MKIVGCDLHARQQTIAMVDTETGEFTEKAILPRGNAVREFYAALAGPVAVASKPPDRCNGLGTAGGWGSSAGWVIQQRSARKRRGSRNTIDGTHA